MASVTKVQHSTSSDSVSSPPNDLQLDDLFAEEGGRGRQGGEGFVISFFRSFNEEFNF
jgi:hypothetical protein